MLASLRGRTKASAPTWVVHPLVTKLHSGVADTSGMDGREIEPRMVMWAVAEISWQDRNGDPCRVPATLEDMSKSGACVRVKRPFEVGSVITIKWHREHFFAIARNCRSDGRDFLLGVRRASGPVAQEAKPAPPAELKEFQPAGAANSHPLLVALQAERQRRTFPEAKLALNAPASTPVAHAPDASNASSPAAARSISVTPQNQALEIRSDSHSSGAPPRLERKGMPAKAVFPKFWRRHETEDAPPSTGSKEVVVNKSSGPAAEAVPGPRAELLSYEDIYHAAGIMSPRSGYSIHKVVEMLNSERLRDLSNEVKRASVLMALDAAGTSADEVLQDASRRQQALNSYESGKKKQLEDFEASSSRENTQIEAEMERIRAHYAERIQHNCDLVAQEKETLHNWQMAMQHESQRISEVIELCSKQLAPVFSPGKVPSGTVDKEKSSTEKSVEQARGAASGRTL